MHFFIFIIACGEGTYGDDCNNICGHCANGGACDLVSGKCTNGCQAGWTGEKCTTRKYIFICHLSP